MRPSATVACSPRREQIDEFADQIKRNGLTRVPTRI
jgi:hypothetical protein